MSDRLLGSLSMARGAGKLKMGFDVSKEAVEDGAPMAVLARDASPRTQREVRRFCPDTCRVVVLPYGMDEIAGRLGKAFAVAAVTDSGFAALISRNLGTDQEEVHDN